MPRARVPCDFRSTKALSTCSFITKLSTPNFEILRVTSSMAFSLSSTPSFPCSTPCTGPGRLNRSSVIVKCEADGSLSGARSKLEVGSPVIVTEAPMMVKTAASVPCLLVNSGLVKPGDVGRYVCFVQTVPKTSLANNSYTLCRRLHMFSIPTSNEEHWEKEYHLFFDFDGKKNFVLYMESVFFSMFSETK